MFVTELIYSSQILDQKYGKTFYVFINLFLHFQSQQRSRISNGVESDLIMRMLKPNGIYYQGVNNKENSVQVSNSAVARTVNDPDELQKMNTHSGNPSN